MTDKNDKGEYALYDQGQLIGYAPVDYVDGVMVIAKIKPKLLEIKAAAKADGVDLTLAAGLRTWGNQLALRKQNVIDKTKINDLDYLTNAPATAFKPMTGKPGYSNHHDGLAYDYNVTGRPGVFEWLSKNALRFGFVRTIPSERWHWENLPYIKDKFYFVKQTDPSWA